MALGDYQKLQRTEFRLQDATTLVQQVAKVNEVEYWMNVNGVTITAWDYPTGTTVLSTGATVRTSQVWSFGGVRAPSVGLVRLVSTIGATPSATVKLEGSDDNSTFANANYALTGDLTTFVTTNLTITTAVTTVYVLKAREYRYYRINVTADTNVTLTGDVVMFGANFTAA